MKRIIGIPINRNRNKNGEQSETTNPSEAPNNPPTKSGRGWFSKLTRKPTEPGLPELISKVDDKVEDIARKIATCETNLKKIGAKLKTTPEGQLKNNLRAKAQTILQRKKKYEQQLDTMQQQSFNMEQTNVSMQTAKDTVFIVKAMRKGVQELKKEQRKIDLDVVEDLHDELQDVMEQSEQIQLSLAANLNMPDIDEEELEEQLQLLGDEIVADNDTSYIDEAVSNRPMTKLNDKNDVAPPITVQQPNAVRSLELPDVPLNDAWYNR